MPHFLRRQILRLISQQHTLSKDLKLLPKLIQVDIQIGSQPLRSQRMPDQNFLADVDLAALHFVPFFGVEVVEQPDRVRGFLFAERDLLAARDFGAALWG